VEEKEEKKEAETPKNNTKDKLKVKEGAGTL